MTAKDPLTNEVIVGEVEFYHMKEGETSAEFFGSDFNFSQSKTFRDKFTSLTNDKDLCNLGLDEGGPASNADGQELHEEEGMTFIEKYAYRNFMHTLQ